MQREDGINAALTTRERILRGAALLFSEQGLAAGSIRNIAAEIGIRGPSIYGHFDSKDMITAAVLREAATVAFRELDRIDVAALASRPGALLDEAVDAHLRAYRDPGRALMALVRIYRQLPDNLFAVARTELRPYLQRWAEIISIIGKDNFSSAGEPEAISLVLFGAMNAMIDWETRPGFAIEPASLKQLFVQFVGHGLAGQHFKIAAN